MTSTFEAFTVIPIDGVFQGRMFSAQLVHTLGSVLAGIQLSVANVPVEHARGSIEHGAAAFARPTAVRVHTFVTFFYTN